MQAIKVVQGDITKMPADAIVNAANTSLLGGGGVDGAIHRAAGPKMQAECRALHGCPTGQAKITHGFNLPAKFVIHTVGPVYHGRTKDADLLAACYRNSLDVAQQHGLHSIIFSAISTGVYGYPAQAAAQIAVKTIHQWLQADHDYAMQVSLCAYDSEMAQILRAANK